VSPEARNNRPSWALEVISVKTGAVRDLAIFSAPARAAAWLPDSSGILVAAIDPETARRQIWFVSYPKGEVSRFTNDLTNYDMCCLDVTRDGGSLVALQDATISETWVSNADGSNPRQITSAEALGPGLDWLGNRIVQGDARGRWFVMNPDGSQRSDLFGDHDPRTGLSACSNAQHVIYTAYRDRTVELWASQPDGSHPVKLTSQPVLFGFCTPDSKSAIYAADGAFWKVSIDGGTPEKLSLPFSEIGFSPDGKLMFANQRTIESGTLQTRLVISPAGGGAPLQTLGSPFGMQSLRFTPDSKGVAFMLTRDRATNVWVQPVAGGNPAPLTKFPSGDMFAFVFSSDGKQLAFLRGQRKTDVVMMTNFR